MDCDNKLLKGGLTNPVACGLRQQELRMDAWKSCREIEEVGPGGVNTGGTIYVGVSPSDG